MEYVKWMVAGVLLGIFVVMTIAISIATYLDIKRTEKEIEMEIFEDDKFEMGQVRTGPERYQ